MHTETQDIIEHYGKKGMRWGVRRARQADGRVGDGEASKPSTSSMSTKDLQAAVSRMNLEKQYGQLQKERQPKSIADTILKKTADIGMSVVTTQATNLANRQVEKLVKAKLG